MNIKGSPKHIILTLLAAFFSLFIWVHHLVLRTFLFFCPNITSFTLKHFEQLCKELEEGTPKRLCSFVQTIANSSISLMLSLFLLHYNDKFLELICFVSHNVHNYYLRSAI